MSIRVISVPVKILKLIPKSVWAILGVTIIFSISAYVVAQNYIATGELEYSSCRIEYGQTVASWDGTSDNEWNKSGRHYEAKIFAISASAPKGFFKNLREVTPTRITSQNCQENINDFIDANKEHYLWHGARAQGIRLGVPDLGEINNAGRTLEDAPSLNTNPSLIPPLSPESYNRAAAKSDDAAKVQIVTKDAQTLDIWCQDNSSDDKCQIDNDSLTDLRSEGYLFTTDNCPHLLDCAQSDNWYKGFSKLTDENLTKAVGRSPRGEILPFTLRTEAVSTYGYEVGAFTILTFEYLAEPEINVDIDVNPAKSAPSGESIVSLNVSKIGTNIANLAISADVSNLPLSEISQFSVSEAELGKINNNESVKLDAKYKIKNATPGECYNLPINITAKSVLGANIKLSPLSGRICIRSESAVYTYDVITMGEVVASFSEFKALAAQTMAHALGWGKAGVSFTQVASGGNFTLVLAAPDKMTSFSSGCDANYSCAVGRYVIINDERWRKATPSWNNSGGSLRDYRHMVINHELGHWLGFGHLNCPSGGAAAPVMQQQSINLQGCKHNPWPTTPEINMLKARV